MCSQSAAGKHGHRMLNIRRHELWSSSCFYWVFLSVPLIKWLEKHQNKQTSSRKSNHMGLLSFRSPFPLILPIFHFLLIASLSYPWNMWKRKGVFKSVSSSCPLWLRAKGSVSSYMVNMSTPDQDYSVLQILFSLRLPLLTVGQMSVRKCCYCKSNMRLQLWDFHDLWVFLASIQWQRGATPPEKPLELLSCYPMLPLKKRKNSCCLSLLQNVPKPRSIN